MFLKTRYPSIKKELFMHKLNIEGISQVIIGDGRDPRKTIEKTFAELAVWLGFFQRVPGS